MTTTHNGKLFIETVGCQMNMLDSELVVGALRKQGYSLTDDPREADTILFNTCSVREHAEHKIYSALGRLKFSKQARPNQVIGVLGCMAQKDQELVFQPFETILADKDDPRLGFGLGLKLVEHIIDLHEGETWFESEAGVGSSFFFTIPV